MTQSRLWIFGLLILASTGPAAADLNHGAQIAVACASCHRFDGRDVGIPSIVGLDAETLMTKMGTFKSNGRSNHIMHAVSLSLSDEEIAAVAHYLATLRKDVGRP